jgi:signal transduction histidine kinase
VFALALIGSLIYRAEIKKYKERNTYLGLINEQQKKLLNAEIEATERERSRIAKDLHDGISTDLATMKFIAEQLNRKTETEEATAIQNQLQRTIIDIRNIVYGLTPPGISKYGLSAALQNYVTKLNEHSPVQIKFDFLGNEITDRQLNTTIFRVIQELVSNSTRHSRSKNICIHINVFTDYLNIVYTDDGIGFDPSLINPGLGLSNIQSRVDSLNGKLDFESGKTGTAYSIDIPLKN